MFYQLPPVGNPVCLDTSSTLSELTVFSSYRSRFYASGTAALAAAVTAAILVMRESVRRSDRAAGQVADQAEIILPAYGCPDLVSAVLFAGAKPVLVDLEADSPWLDLSQLSSAITENTAAIVAVDLFGIAERWSQLRDIASQNNLVLIEDSAQYFPSGHEASTWQGDLVVLSFGRGKPVSLLGGGAVLAKNSSLGELLPETQSIPETIGKRLSYTLKSRAYNAMIAPVLYWFPQSLPFLHLGETRYHPLPEIASMDQVRLDRLASNIICYQNDVDAMARCEKISSMLASIPEVNNLPQISQSAEKPRLLRYPLLVEATSRNRIYQRLKQAGLGVSTMYPSSLPGIAGLGQILDKQQVFENAEAFASRILTLPTHASVSDRSIAKMRVIISEYV